MRRVLAKEEQQLAAKIPGGPMPGLPYGESIGYATREEVVRARPVSVPQQQKQQHGLTSSLCLLLDSGRLGMAEEEVVVVVWPYSTNTSIHPLGGSPSPPGGVPPYPWRRSPQLPSSQFLRMRSVAQQQQQPGRAPSSNGRVQGTKCLGGEEWTIAPRDGRGHNTAHWSQKPGTDDRLWEGPGSTE